MNSLPKHCNSLIVKHLRGEKYSSIMTRNLSSKNKAFISCAGNESFMFLEKKVLSDTGEEYLFMLQGF